MATHSGAAKSQRKLATYGKSSHRHDFGFDVPSSPEQSEDELQSGPTLLHTPLQKANVQKSLPSSQPLQKQTAKKDEAAERGRGALSSPSIRKAPPVNVGAPEKDPFDVPSSGDEDAPSASPFKPAVKRRRIPGNDRNGTLTPISGKTGDRKKEPWPSEVEKSDEISRPTPTKTSSPLPRKVTSKLSSNKLNAGGPLSRSDKTTPRLEGTKRKAPESKGPPRKLPSPDRRLANESTSLSAKTSTQDLHSVARPRSAGSPVREAGHSISEPRTPPSERRHRALLNPDEEKDVSQESAFAFLSPSGLDFLGLDISENAESNSSKRDTRDLDSRPASALRAKLKDRLTKRDGASLSDSDGDYLMGFQEDNISTTNATQPLIKIQENSLGQDEESSGLISSQPEPDSAPRIALGTSPRHTYAARNRTFRKDENSTEDDILTSLAEANEPTSTGARRIRTDVQPKSSQEVSKESMDFDVSDDGEVLALRNIHELREAGANARLRGETEAVLDEVESENTSTRRYGFLNLLEKLRAKAFRDAFGASGLDSRLLGRIHAGMDMISNVLFSMALLQILTGQASSQALLQSSRPEVFRFFEPLLKETESLKLIARNRKSNTTKALQQGIEEECKSYTQSSVWKFGEPAKITPRVISLHLLEYLTRYLRNSGTTGAILPSSLMEQLTEILVSSSPLSTDAVDLEFRITLSILEASTLGGNDSSQSLGHWHAQLLDNMADVIVSARGWDLKEHAQDLSLSLRLGINVTNGDMAACSGFARPVVLNAVTGVIESHFGSISETEIHAQASLLDNLILALGLLINLAENSRPARELFARSSDGKASPLDTFLQLFTSRWVQAFEVTSEEESRESVPLGYLAVLLAFISTEPSNRAYVASQLEGGSLRHLLIALDAFLSYHRKVAEDLHGGEDSPEFKVHFVGRVQAVLDQLKRS